MRWLITGGTGFLGTNLLRSLNSTDGEVIVLSRTPARWKLEHPHIRFIEQDIREIDVYKNLLTPETVVVHMAASTYPGKAEKAIESDIHDNLLTTVRLAQICAERKVHSFIFLSTGGAIYGEQAVQPISELALPFPRTVYGAMKLSTEEYLRVLHHLNGLPVAMLRVGNAFGPWHPGRGQGAINVFMHNVLLGEPITIWGDGSVVRDYVPAQDVAAAIRVVAEHFHAGCEAYNVATSQGRSLNDVLGAIKNLTEKPVQVNYEPARIVDVQKNVLDCRKIHEAFGWKSETLFQVALADTWNWMKEQTVS